VRIEQMTVEVIDSVADYAELMQQLFDFDAIRALFAGGFRMCFDGMHAVSGPYAKAILEGMLGAPRAPSSTPCRWKTSAATIPTRIRSTPQELIAIMAADDAPDFGAASDGDGDRNMIVGRASTSRRRTAWPCWPPTPVAPGYRGGLKASPVPCPPRARPTGSPRAGHSMLRDADRLEILRHPARRGMATLCGEESYGTGSNHVREKDGVWAVLFWLNLLAAKNNRWKTSCVPTGPRTAATTIRGMITRTSTAPPRRN
jgi:phosphoglucomutase